MSVVARFDVEALIADLRDDGLEAEWAGYIAHEYDACEGPLDDEITGNALTGRTEMVLIDTMRDHDIGAEFAALLVEALRARLVKNQTTDDGQS